MQRSDLLLIFAPSKLNNELLTIKTFEIMEEFKIVDYTVKNCGVYYKVYDENDKDVTRKFNDNVVIKDDNELSEVVDNIRASFFKDWKSITNKKIYKLFKWSYPHDEDIVYMKHEDGNECIRFYIEYYHSMYIDLDVRNVRDLEIVKNIYKNGIDYIRKRLRYHDRYVIEKLLNSICENFSIKAVPSFLVRLFDNDKDFYQEKWYKRDEDLYVGYIKVDYGNATYIYEDKDGDEDDIYIHNKVIEFRDFILSII